MEIGSTLLKSANEAYQLPSKVVSAAGVRISPRVDNKGILSIALSKHEVMKEATFTMKPGMAPILLYPSNLDEFWCSSTEDKEWVSWIIL